MGGEVSSDPGITVAGGISGQKFSSVGWFQMEEKSYVIILKLVGAVGGKQVKKPITVKTKVKCQSCGTVSKAGAMFCKDCGTSLEIV